ncbi:MAG TPA: prolipoprotein diacylglyceryl transferase family protein [Thermoanaerobaculia bacterium]|nr:prolipoprotein diacylglyceryl transferase family protein [Thermoanaerobaculia bacterium]
MYPTLIRIGHFEITTFGLMMFIAFIVSGWVLARQLKRSGIDDDFASSMVMAAAIGGIIGAKVYYAILFRDWHLLFERAGLVWYGGMMGGAAAVSWVIYRRGVNYFVAADAAAPAMAIGYCLGRIGCFLVGDDYGAPTNSWVGVAFPKGSPPTTAAALRDFGVNVDPSIPPDQILRVHPTQIYESLSALVMFLILIRYNARPHPRGRALGILLILLGIERFLVEIVRAKDDRFLGPFTIAQLISAIAVVVGITLVARARGSELGVRSSG